MSDFELIWEGVLSSLMDETREGLGSVFGSVPVSLWKKLGRAAASLAISETATLLGLNDDGAATETAETYLCDFASGNELERRVAAEFVRAAASVGQKMAVTAVQNGRDMLIEWAEDFKRDCLL